MVIYRYSVVAQCLKNTSQALAIAGPGGRSVAPRFVYRPILSDAPALVTSSASQMSGGHGIVDHSHLKVPKEWEGWQNWKSPADVPDHLVKMTSERDPNNAIYSHPDYIKHRKEQIFFQIPDGKPVWLKYKRDYVMLAVVVAAMAINGALISYDLYWEIYGKYYSV
ncbi:hypothetical protein HDE_12454 [Halotydeus destructor]|nr:hypothetical protein HDE_12454 [Halotydeus destructor]